MPLQGAGGLWGARGKVMGRRMKGHIQTPEKRQGEAPKETRTFKTAVSVGEVELKRPQKPRDEAPPESLQEHRASTPGRVKVCTGTVRSLGEAGVLSNAGFQQKMKRQQRNREIGPFERTK